MQEQLDIHYTNILPGDVAVSSVNNSRLAVKRQVPSPRAGDTGYATVKITDYLTNRVAGTWIVTSHGDKTFQMHRPIEMPDGSMVERVGPDLVERFTKEWSVAHGGQ